MRAILALLALMLVGCPDSPRPQPPPGNDYCAGTPPPSIFEDIAAKISTIIGGEPSTDRRATALVQIGTSGYCSGTVVGPRTVLTAAHCNGNTDITVRIDSLEFMATDKLVHPDYISFPYHDLMLLYFEDNILPGPVVNTVYSAASHEDCTSLVAQGWGKSETAAIDLNESLYSVVSVSPQTLSTKQVNPGGICFGDSGGPLYAVVGGELQIAGVTSTTYSQDCLIGGDHVNLDHYRQWLTDNIQ